MRVILGTLYTIFVIVLTTLVSGCVAEMFRHGSWWGILGYIVLILIVFRPLDHLFSLLYLPYAALLRKPWHSFLYAILYLVAFVGATWFIWARMLTYEGHWIIGGIFGTLATISLIYMKAMYLFAGLDEYYKRHGL